MLAKGNRAGRKEVALIFKQGWGIRGSLLSFRYLRGSGRQAHVSFVAPKSVSRSAVMRNRLRRQGYAALAPYLSGIPAGTLGVFVFNSPPGKASVPGESVSARLSHDIEKIIRKIN